MVAPLTGGQRPLAAELVAALSLAGESVALAESCTGGAVLAALTSVPGASKCIWGGCVVYADAAKADLVGVPEDLIAAAGAVSARVTRALAERVRTLGGTTYGAAVTGWAGPEPGAEPAGTIYVAVAQAGGCECQRAVYDGDRSSVREQAVDAVLEALFEAQQEVGRQCS